jgi:uncharacterized protein YkwD
MKKFTGLILVACFWLFVNNPALLAQQYPFEKWDSLTLKKANTAKDVSYMTEDEKKVIFYINLARMNPKLFSETYLKQYLDAVQADSSVGREELTYIISLQSDLKPAKKMDALLPLKELYESANVHAKNMGESGKTGHANYDKRFLKVTKNHNNYVTGENCDYGNAEPLAIVLDLLIDAGVSGCGHRKNILNKYFVSIAASIEPHKKYGWNCVIDFVGGQESTSEKKNWLRSWFGFLFKK